MYLMVFFDLPTMQKQQRRAAAAFRKYLLNDGFCMMQKSVYVRRCHNQDDAAKHEQRIKHNLPAEGTVYLQTITEQQYNRILRFENAKPMAMPHWGTTEYGIEIL